MELKAVEVRGRSMFPYLRSGDILLFETYTGTQVPLGALVLAKRAQELVVHRHIGHGHIKGDAVKAADHRAFGPTETLGVALWRVLPSGKQVCLQGRAKGLCFSLMALLSRWNTSQVAGLDRLAFAGICLLGLALRYWEERA